MCPSSSASSGAAEATAPAVKPSPDRLYGRRRTHALRARQALLLEQVLPRFRYAGLPQPDLWLEIGFGGGEHARAFAAANPSVGLIAAEVFDQGLCSMLAALVPAGAEATALPPANLRLWPEDARGLIAQLPPAALAGAILLFPDPWPKARHAKRRFIHPTTVAAMARVLRPGAEWRIATDDPTYQEWVDEVMAASPDFRPAARGTSRPPGWPPTRYEARALAAGRIPLYWRFLRAR